MSVETLVLASLLVLGAVLLKLNSTLALFWDRWTDKPKLKIKIENKTKILDDRYTFKVSVLNKGRKDAYNCRVSVQVFDQKSGKKIDEYPLLESDLKSGEAKPFPMSGLLAFNGNFVARISAETPKSKVNKIVEYNIRNNYGHIMLEKGIVPYLWFHLNKHLLKKYQSGWGTEFLANELKNFSGQNIRKELIEKLGEIGDDKVVEPLIDCLQNDTNEVVRDRVAGALGNIGDKRAVDPLLECLKNGKVDPRWCASAIVEICNQKCDQASVKKLSDLLAHDNIPPYTRGVIAESLGEIREELRNENIEGALIDALDDFDGDDLCSVVKALGKVGGEKALKQLENIEHDCSDIFKNAVEQIRFRIHRGGGNIAEK
ncbi:hypothetical protein DRO03_10795 [Methanosarcinales archaeon]|nr:MAG: hypothetical protein DRO03_10795 [Methanosarcinales archaeon]